MLLPRSPTVPTTLAQASTTSVLLWLGAMILLILFGGIAAMWIRRSFRAEGVDGAPLESLSLHQLRRLHAQGRLTDEEFETLKQIAVRAHTVRSEPSPAPREKSFLPDGHRAKPGFDLTGEPLPGVSDGGENPPGHTGSGPDAGPAPDPESGDC